MKQFSFQSAGIGSQTAPPSSPAQRHDSSGFSEGFLKGSLRLGCFCVIGAATAAHRWRQRRRHTSEPWQDYSGFFRSIQDFFQDSSRITFIEREGWFFGAGTRSQMAPPSRTKVGSTLRCALGLDPAHCEGFFQDFQHRPGISFRILQDSLAKSFNVF